MGEVLLDELVLCRVVEHIFNDRDVLAFGRTCRLLHREVQSDLIWTNAMLSSLVDVKVRQSVISLLPHVRKGHVYWLYQLTKLKLTCRACCKKHTIQNNKADACEHYYHEPDKEKYYYSCCKDYGDGCTGRKQHHLSTIFVSPTKWDIYQYPTFKSIGSRVVLVFRLAYLWPAAANIKTLSLAGNDLSELEACFLLKQITMLDLSNNKLTELPEEIGEMTELNDLSIAGNMITTLPSSMYKLYPYHSSHNFLVEPLQTLLKDMPPFVALYYLRCQANDEVFDMNNVPIPEHRVKQMPFKMKMYLTHTPSMEVPLDVFSGRIAPSTTNTDSLQLKLEPHTMTIETSLTEAAPKAYWSQKYWSEAAGIIVFTNRNLEEAKHFLSELHPHLSPDSKIMVVVVSREEDELDMTSAQWDLSSLDSDKQAVSVEVVTEVWVQQYDFSEVMKSHAFIGRACKDLNIKSNQATTLLPDFKRFLLEHVFRHSFDARRHFLPELQGSKLIYLKTMAPPATPATVTMSAMGKRSKRALPNKLTSCSLSLFFPRHPLPLFVLSPVFPPHFNPSYVTLFKHYDQ